MLSCSSNLTPPLSENLKKNSKDTVRVMLHQYQGLDLLGIRVFYRDKETGDLKPGKDGLNIRVDQFPRLGAEILFRHDAKAGTFGKATADFHRIMFRKRRAGWPTYRAGFIGIVWY